ncbi:hypothetical protein KEF85_05740 [Methylomonas paludis]|uniref:Spore coat protein U domain-containing protein n=1 Tax=Methylomonas paludis TaxID=1173101 RepID=A0A975RAA8_9GAMM|nr:hypothetical protein [Methylomonas paludis]QWF71957.1 hypothetical protein KEF85_05740 [Methylomonas paludis]
MKYLKLIALGLLIYSASASAETIDVHLDGNLFAKIGTSNPVCGVLTLIKRNSGALVTGLTTANIELISVTETAFSPTGSPFDRSINLTASVTHTNTLGVYKLCLTPSRSSWPTDSGSALNLNPSYLVSGLVKAGPNDNGYFSATISSGN